MHSFYWGIAGGAAAVVVELYRNLHADDPTGLRPPRRVLPPGYRSATYWIIRTSVIIVGGVVAAMYNPSEAPVAFALGAAAPVIVQRLMSRPTAGNTAPPSQQQP
jgi:hypothetical protein